MKMTELEDWQHATMRLRKPRPIRGLPLIFDGPRQFAEEARRQGWKR